jgi:hypothetical protein
MAPTAGRKRRREATVLDDRFGHARGTAGILSSGSAAHDPDAGVSNAAAFRA